MLGVIVRVGVNVSIKKNVQGIMKQTSCRVECGLFYVNANGDLLQQMQSDGWF